MGDRSRFGGQVGTRRGVRGGGSARRKRLAWAQYNLNQGRQWDDIPVAHSGGQQRPLYSSWEPTASGSEEDTAVDVIGEGQITVEVASSEEEPAEVESVPLVQPIQPVWLGPRPKGYSKGSWWET